MNLDESLCSPIGRRHVTQNHFSVGSNPTTGTKSSMPRRIMAVRGLLMSDGRGSNPLEATIQNSIANINLV